jgi:chromate reductase, NAD(P)H dehydrogenase (quinone)
LTTPIQILGIPGSLRAGSFNRAALAAAAELLPPQARLEIYDLRPIPMYDGDLEQQGLPPAVLELRSAIAAADALLIATPEYYYSISGVLKNAIDWVGRPPLPSPFVGKPVAILGAATSPFGTARSQLHLRQILGHFDVRLLAQPEVYIANAADKFDGAGKLADQATRDAIGALGAALLAWVAQLRH